MKLSKNAAQRTLSVLFVVFIILFIVSWLNRGRYPDSSGIHPDLFKNPVQEDTAREPFTVDYMGVTYSITPVKEYECWGLVASHNKTAFIFDIYHDRKSFDTKDISLVWGDNLKSNDFHRVKYWSEPWSGWYRPERGARFYHNHYSNNHLITSSGYVRYRIAGIRKGDQVRIKGMLVNYAHPRWGGFARNTSVIREDTGNGACEIIFVEDIEVLRQCTPGWYGAFAVSLWMLVLVPAAKFLVFLAAT